ncbi:MAG TPA: ATP-binding protein [Bacillota bacterium]|nr:ATP-binding protein [Bacillota bacterium]
MAKGGGSMGAIWEAAERRKRVLAAHPRLAALEAAVAQSLFASASNGGLSAWTTAAREARNAYLLKNGIPADYAEPRWNCSLCQDEGYVNGASCTCREQAELSHRFTGSRLPDMLRHQTFDKFDLKWYSASKKAAAGMTERGYAKLAYEASLSFVAEVLQGDNPRGLFISGGVGLGKTFLLSAICNSLIEGGVPTLYTVFSDLISDIKRSFGADERGMTESALMEAARGVRVLILDDLGAEQVTEFVQSRLFDIVNYRRNHDLPLVASSNLSINEIGSMYGLRISSRLTEMCNPISLYGNDIRLQKERQH